MKTVSKVEGKFSYIINDESKEDGHFKIPVVDVRDGKQARATINAMLKANNEDKGSRYMSERFSVIGRSYRVNYFK